MNKTNSYLKIIAFTLLLGLSVTAFSQSDTSDEKLFQQLSREAFDSYKQGKLKRAEKAASKAITIATRTFGATDNQTGTAYRNLGEIQRVRKRNKRAAVSLQKALDVFQTPPVVDDSLISKTMESLANALALSGRKEQAESIFLRSIKTAESKYGDNSSNLIPFLKSTGYFYILVKNYRKAEDLFVRRYLLARKLSSKDRDLTEGIHDEIYCLQPRVRDFDFKKFWKRVRKSQNSKTGGVLNGKAISLPKPEYPQRARSVWASGVISIAVRINKEGVVTQARAICGGNRYLIASAREAALRARFKPTKITGETIGISGVIVYSFRP